MAGRGGSVSGSGASGGKGTGVPALQRWIDDMGSMELRKKQLQAEEQHAGQQATQRLFMTLLDEQIKGEQVLAQQAAEQQAQAQAAAGAAGPFQVNVESSSPLAQRPVSFDRPLTQMPASFEAMLLAATQGQGAGNALQPGAQAGAPGGGGAAGPAALPAAAAGLPVAGATQQTRSTQMGMQGQVVEDPFRFLMLANPSFSQTTTETPNELTADDVAGLRIQEAQAAEQQRTNRAGEAVDVRRATTEEARARGDYARDTEKLAIDRAQLEINREEARVRMAVARAQALAQGQKFTPGEEALDKSYADKQYAPQLGGGLSAAAADIESLKAITEELYTASQPGAAQNLTGPLLGALPNGVASAVNPPAGDLRRRLESVLQKSAGTVLDSQYAAKEMADYLKREADTQQEEGVVVQRLVPLVHRLEFDLGEAVRKAEHFRGNGTLRGYTPQPVPEALSDQALRASREPAAPEQGVPDDTELFKRYGIQ